jgi:hypothetical protein
MKKVQYFNNFTMYILFYYRYQLLPYRYWTTYFNQWPQNCPGIRIRGSGSSSDNIYGSTTLIQINTAGFILPDLGIESQKRMESKKSVKIDTVWLN